MFSMELKQAISEVSGMIASDALADFDCEEAGCTEGEVVAELTLDANRLETNGYPHADAEISDLIRSYGYDAVLTEAEKHVRY